MSGLSRVIFRHLKCQFQLVGMLKLCTVQEANISCNETCLAHDVDLTLLSDLNRIAVLKVVFLSYSPRKT